MTGMSDLALRTPTALRAVTAHDAPFAGLLMAGDPPTVWVDAGDFGASACWRAAPDGHLLAAQDAAHGPDGPVAVLPHCPDRLVDALTRRSSIAAGECVTVAISLVRGAVEADALGAENGEWWLTAMSRPVLALTGPVAWRVRTEGVLADLAARVDADVAGVLRHTAEVISDRRRLHTEAAACEDALFALAAAAAWHSEPGTGEVRRVDVAARMSPTPSREDLPLWDTVRAWTTRLVDADVAERVHDALRSLPRLRLPSRQRPAAGRPASRRRPIVVAAVLAALLIAVGALWPAEDTPALPEAVDPAASAAPASSAPREAAAASTLAEAADALIAQVAACYTSECRAALWEDASRAAPAGIVTDPGAARAVSVLDEYGGVAVLRVEDPSGTQPAQVVVVVQDGRKWLVREVYDLADQP